MGRWGALLLGQGHTSRNVYLTAGEWQDLLNPTYTFSSTGGQWLEGYDAPLHKLPCFVKVSPSSN